MTDFEKSMLDMLVSNIPLDPPLKPGGEVTIKEMFPDLTDEELAYIKTQYTGTMTV